MWTCPGDVRCHSASPNLALGILSAFVGTLCFTLSIEQAVRENGDLSTLVLRTFRPGDLLAGGLSVTLGSLAELPAAASVLLGSGTAVSMTAHNAYKEWKESCDKIESNHMFFYYETRERLVALGSAPNKTTLLLREAAPEVVEPAKEAEGAAQVDDAPGDAEREAQEFMDENEDLLDEGGYATLQRLLTQGYKAKRDLIVELTEVTKRYASAKRALNEAVGNSSMRARRIYELEREVERLKPVLERKKRLNEEFTEFIDRAESAYKREGGELKED
jgi:hypothetical protein